VRDFEVMLADIQRWRVKEGQSAECASLNLRGILEVFNWAEKIVQELPLITLPAFAPECPWRR
jgi:hypothetical protein